jgi:hypothetical protein
LFPAVTTASARTGPASRGRIEWVTVEFLPSDEVPEPPAPERARVTSRRRWWWLLGALLVVAAAAYLVNRPSTHQPSRHVSRPIAECRGVPDCAVRDQVPAQLVRLARADLPPGANLRVRTVFAVDSLTHDNLLVSRTIVASTDWVTVTIHVDRSSNERVVPALHALSFRELSLRGINSGFVVRLQYLAPPDIPPRKALLQALIRDPRLAIV